METLKINPQESFGRVVQLLEKTAPDRAPFPLAFPFQLSVCRNSLTHRTAFLLPAQFFRRWGIQYWGAPTALLSCGRSVFGQWQTGLDGEERGPARRWDFEHSQVVGCKTV